MGLSMVGATDVLQQLDGYDTIIDARSEAEFALDHLPGAVNWPTLDDQQRHAIGTIYKQVDAFEAKKRGAALAAANIARHIETHVLNRPRTWKPLVYCWRGGKRSGSLALVLDQIGFRVAVLDGGYKAFRAAMLADIARLAGGLEFRVVCGTTGSGKTRFLHALAKRGAQTVDLEALACHRSSVLGAIPGQAQPSQKGFDTQVWNALRRLNQTSPVFVESESRKVGNVVVPTSLMEVMRASQCINLVLDDQERAGLLMEDYDYFVRDQAAFCARLAVLTDIRGKAVVEGWIAAVQQGRIREVVLELLTMHYDPVYLQSMRRNFCHYSAARVLHAPDRTEAAMAALAGLLVNGQTAAGA